jgi:hypothetical protein
MAEEKERRPTNAEIASVVVGVFLVDGILKLHFWRHQWWIWTGRSYQRLPYQELPMLVRDAILTLFFGRFGDLSTVKSVINELKDQGRVYLPESWAPPFFVPPR